jgi:3-methyladenine DNA glycosylase AlkD
MGAEAEFCDLIPPNFEVFVHEPTYGHSRKKAMSDQPLMNAAAIRSALAQLADPARAKLSAGFFKTAPGQYGHGDRFLGLSVPQLRELAKRCQGLPLAQALALLKNGAHEERLLALLLMVQLWEKSKDEKARAVITKAYLANLKWVNNWDLVDSSAQFILGAWLFDKDRAPLYKLAESKVLWERRVAIIASFHFIYQGDSKDTLKLAERLLNDSEDLMHKAVGWMLREVGKRVSVDELRAFLKKHAAKMPRTALRYAIERLPESERKKLMASK